MTSVKQIKMIPPHTESLPWWRYGIMWLVVGGPVVVVFAAIASAVIAIRGADVELNAVNHGHGAAQMGQPPKRAATLPAAKR
jgi:hypothetical protein